MTPQPTTRAAQNPDAELRDYVNDLFGYPV
jgi:hypothetical protein